MSPALFDTLLELMNDSLVKNSQRKPICPAYRLAVTLRFLATGESFRSIGTAYRMGFSTVQSIVTETCKVLYANLRGTYLQTPTTTEEWKRIAGDFAERWNVPHALGFETSDLKRALDSGELNLPAPSELYPGGPKMSYFCIGDSAFSLTVRMMKPLCRARRVIENVFGIRSQRWRVLLTTIGTLPDNADNIVRAVCVLHNFLIDESPRGQTHPVADADNGDDDDGRWRANATQLRQPQMRKKFANRATQVAHDYRETLLQYFNGVGRVDWQDNMVDV